MTLCLTVLWFLGAVGPQEPRSLWIYNAHTHEERRDRPFVQYGLVETQRWAGWSRIFRSWRTQERRTVNPRLLRVLAQIQSYFGGRRLELVSGFRSPKDPGDLHSYHQLARAADFYIRGVANEALYAYCRTLTNVGCGYYPNGIHVHVDVRSRNSIWTDPQTRNRN